LTGASAAPAASEPGATAAVVAAASLTLGSMGAAAAALLSATRPPVTGLLLDTLCRMGHCWLFVLLWLLRYVVLLLELQQLLHLMLCV